MFLRSSFYFIILIMVFQFPGFAQTVSVIEKDKLLQDPLWKEIYDQTEISALELEKLRSVLAYNIKIEVYFAFWCSDSRQQLPVFLKIFDLLECPVELIFLQVEKKSSSEIEFYCKEKEVRRIPTFIIYRNEQEIGRIVETPENSILLDLLAILEK